MRTIKFRKWDKEDGVMIDGDSLAFEEYAPIAGLLSQEGAMQFTGLTDRNGKEIYEGDIVEYLDGNEWSTESGYDCEEFNNRGVIFFDDECGRYDVTNKQGISYEDLFDCGVDFVVLGNIYENPELMPKD